MACGTGKTLAAMWIAERLELGLGLAKVGTFLALARIIALVDFVPVRGPEGLAV